MTDPKLREARIARAKEMADARNVSMTYQTYVVTVANHLADLIESDWRPEPEVDAVTLAAREWGAADYPMGAEDIMDGKCDAQMWAGAFRAGHAHALANCADVRRMDWLDYRGVVVWEGGAVRISAGLEPLRTKIDRAMEGGQ